MVTELQNGLTWVQSNKTHCHSFRVKERVGIVINLQNALSELQNNRARYHGYRVTNGVAVVTE